MRLSFFLIFAVALCVSALAARLPFILLGGSVWTPIVKAPVVWVSADLNVTKSGSDVTTWGDRSGHAYDLILQGAGVAGVAMQSPVYSATSFLGLPGITFNGVRQGLGRAGLGGSTRSAWTWAMVVKPLTYGSEDTVFYPPNNSDWTLESNGTYVENALAGNQNFDYVVQPAYKATTPTLSMLTDRPQIIGGSYDGTTLTSRINNIEYSSVAVANAHIGDKLAMATLLPAYDGYGWNTVVSEFVLFPTAFSESDWTTLNNYFKRKWFSSLWAGNTRSFNYNGTNTTASGGVQSSLNFTKGQKKAFSWWWRYPNGSHPKGSVFCHEKKTAPTYKGWDAFLYSDGTLNWYAASDFGAGDALLVGTSTAVPSNGKQWVHLTVYDDGSGTAAGIHFFFGKTEMAKAAASFDGLTGAIDDATLEYIMGDANLDSGHDFPAGDISDAAIIIGQTVDSTFISTYLEPNGYPGDLSSVPGIHNWWKFGGPSDTTTTLVDSIGGVNLTVSGTGAFVSEKPSL